ncbi:hypothetical protein ACIPMU_38815 [Streptomyces cyaneofuscatus]|uniref:hypothetical protein n=1 Tax=Streptomyces cyaneofuscatus TaxID=66883 RepID=UPI003811C235
MSVGDQVVFRSGSATIDRTRSRLAPPFMADRAAGRILAQTPERVKHLSEAEMRRSRGIGVTMAAALASQLCKVLITGGYA